jgi:hypothetical protein
VLGAIFLWTAATKLHHPYDFLLSVYDYRLVGPTLGFWIATALPWLELLLGVSLMSGVLERGGLVVAIGLLCVFAYARISALSRDLPISCGCTTRVVEPMSWTGVYGTLAMLAGAVVALWASLVPFPVHEFRGATGEVFGDSVAAAGDPK